MVSILPMVDLLGNTAVDWFCILSYFRLDTLSCVCIHSLSHRSAIVSTQSDQKQSGSYEMVSVAVTVCIILYYIINIWWLQDTYDNIYTTNGFDHIFLKGDSLYSIVSKML